MSPLRNDTFLRALMRQPTEYTPLWLMRQAGRYLPEYCATRKRAGSFLNLCKSPTMACEVTLQPLERYDLDAAILFSDILTVPDAMGLGLYFAEGEGPRFERPLRDEAEIMKLTAPDPAGELRYVTDAVSEIRRALDGRVPLIGFSGSPWTLACYMVEGSSSKDYLQIKTMAYQRPDLLHRILDVTADAVVAYLNAQIDAGAQAVMIFDSWGGVLSHAAYREFSLQYMEKIVAGLRKEADGRRVPSIVFAVNKLDAVADAPLAFANIRHALESFAREADIALAGIVPISALYGNNVARADSLWCGYRGPGLLELLEQLPATSTETTVAPAFPVQWVEKLADDNGAISGIAWKYDTPDRVGDMVAPGAFQTWVLMDERMDSINDGFFVVWMTGYPNLSSTKWVDFPASYHNKAAGFSFADGHAEIHKWVDKRTTPAIRPNARLQLNVPQPNNLDIKWLQDHTTRPHQR